MVFLSDILPIKDLFSFHFLNKRMSESSSPPKVGIYEKFRSFTAKHLAPINTLLLLGATFGGGQLLDRLGLLPTRTPMEQQKPVVKQEALVVKPGAVAEAASVLSPPSPAPMPVVTGSQAPVSTSARQKKPTAAAQADGEAVRTLNKQLDDERLKHANAILDANLK